MVCCMGTQAPYTALHVPAEHSSTAWQVVCWAANRRHSNEWQAD